MDLPKQEAPQVLHNYEGTKTGFPSIAQKPSGEKSRQTVFSFVPYV